MNKGDIRTRVLEQVDWQPDQSTAFKAKVDRFINRAYQILSLEAPFLFFEDELKIVTAQDASQTTAVTTDRLNVNTTDKYVLERTYLTTTASTLTSWATDGTWDGRTIEVEKSDGTVVRRVIREIWTQISGPNTIDRISIDLPWDNASDTAMPYRIFTAEYYLPADLIELRSARLFSSTHYSLEVSTQYDMERYEYLDYRGDESGRPYRIFRGKHFQIDAPTLAPAVAINTAGTNWFGPDPGGKFDYCYTYVHGKRDTAVKNENDLYEPLWESSPSPISATITHTGAANARIALTLPNVDHIANFYQEFDSGTSTVVDRPRKTHSGLRKRIYVRRYSSIVVSGMASTPVLESSEIFFLLAEVDGDTEAYFHDGTDVPVYQHRLKATHGYQSVRFWPMPDSRYEVDIRALRRPAPLVHDQDTPRLHPEAIDALIERILVLFYEAQGNPEMAGLANMRYDKLSGLMAKRYGNLNRLRPRKRAARVRRASRENRVVFTETS